MSNFAELLERLSSSDPGDVREGVNILLTGKSGSPAVLTLFEELDDNPSFLPKAREIFSLVPRQELYSRLPQHLSGLRSEEFGKALSAVVADDDFETSRFLTELFYSLDSGSKKKIVLEMIGKMDTLPLDPDHAVIDHYLDQNRFLREMGILFNHPAREIRDKGLMLLSSTGSTKATGLYLGFFRREPSNDLKLRWIKYLSRFSHADALAMIGEVADDMGTELLDDLNIFLREVARTNPALFLDFLTGVKTKKSFFSGVSPSLKGIVDLEFLPRLTEASLNNPSLESRKAFFAAVENLVSYQVEKNRMLENGSSQDLCRSEVRKLLESKDRTIRQGVFVLMLKFGGPGIASVMEHYLKTDEEEQKFIEKYLRGISPELVLPLLNDMMSLNNQTALKSLVQLIRNIENQEYIPFIVRVIAREESMRDSAIDCVKQMGLSAKYQSLCTDPDEEIRYWACYLLRFFKTDSTLKMLRERMADPSIRVRSVVVETMYYFDGFSGMFGFLEEAFDDPDEGVREKAVDVLGLIGSDEAHGMLQKSLSKFNNQRLKDKIVGYITAKKKQSLLENFDQLPKDQRTVMAKSIYRLDRNLIEDLKAKMNDLSPDVRFKAVEILTTITDKGDLSIVPLLHKAASDPDKKVRAMITEALGRSGDKISYRILLKLLNDPNDRVRANVVESLEKYGKTEEVISLLVPFLEDKNNRVRANAIIALWRLGYKNIWHSVKSLLDSDDAIFVASGLFALRKIEFKGPFEFLHKYFSMDSSILKINLLITLEELGAVNQFRNGIRKFLKDDDQRVSQKALELLEK
ncbi:MAG: HEAT repeat domain-containing protein [Candidatus Wallbacteria bacterium]|nr:HEAT repeat domain-containing protein [Candidatus Wallbacteria bacterium]